jgi:polyhydroxyalkanoate synthase
VAGKNRPTAAEWRALAESHSGSWWEDWTEWAGKRADKLTTPPPMGSRRHQVLGETPGDYIHG